MKYLIIFTFIIYMLFIIYMFYEIKDNSYISWNLTIDGSEIILHY